MSISDAPHRRRETMTLRLACLLAPGPKTVEHALLAEALGYDRVWLADSPALWQDIWARMALVAEHTYRVQLGTAVLIPSLRHVVTQAAAIATIADIAPGRLTVGLGTGFTGRAALGQHTRLPWAVAMRYHMAYEYGGERVDALPNGRAWRERIEQLPAATRHLAVHFGHCVELNEHDAACVDMTAAKQLSFTGTAGELRERLATMEAQGATEVMFGVMGADVPRELRAFAQLMGR
jgi:alkanesulfonate monooxygenase SsuD/methylene tetrahydromethanopterin reductase-like flavin-dependent oxidoreductase (luciferase family)